MKTTLAPQGKKSASKGLTITRREEVQITDIVVVKLKVPKAVAALVQPDRSYYAEIRSANVTKHLDDAVAFRVKQWNESTTEVGKPRNRHLAAILKQELDTTITARFPADEWPLLEEVCERLGITPREWLLASAHYNAGVEARQAKAGRKIA